MGGAKLERLIKKFVGGRRVEECRIPLAVIATDLRSGEVVVFREGDLASVVRASISVPWVFRPVEIDGRLLADGGLSMPVPAEPVRDIGGDVVIAVDLDWERPLSDPSDVQAPGVRRSGTRPSPCCVVTSRHKMRGTQMSSFARASAARSGGTGSWIQRNWSSVDGRRWLRR